MNDKRDQLYSNLIGSGRVSEVEIGSLDEFKQAVRDEKSARQFYSNLMGSGLFGEEELGNEDEFYGSLASDFMDNQGVAASTGGEQPKGGDEEMQNGSAVSPYMQAQPYEAVYELGGEKQPAPLGPEKFAQAMQVQQVQQGVGQMVQDFARKVEQVSRDNQPFGKPIDALAPAGKAKARREADERRREADERAQEGIEMATLEMRQNKEAARLTWAAANARAGEQWRFGRPISNNAARLKERDLDRLMDEAWERMDGELKERAIKKVERVLVEVYGMPRNDEETRNMAEKVVRGESDRMMYEQAVEGNMPRSWVEHILNKVNGNIIGTLAEAWARAKAGTIGDMQARDEASQAYGKEHRLADIVGGVGSVALDAGTLLAGGVGTATGAAVGAGARAMAMAVGRKAGLKAAGRALTAGKVAQGMAAGAANLATFEVMGGGANQLKYGGKVKVDEKSGRYVVEGYDAGEILSAAGRGAILGVGTGVAGTMIGNVGGKIYERVGSTAGKIGVRAGQTATSIAVEGTIFALPEFMKGEGDWDTWLESVEMMAGFKVQGAVMSTKQTIAKLKKNPESRARFETRVRAMLDGEPSLRLTKDEIAELERKGYSDLAEMVEGYKGASKSQREAIEKKQPIYLEPDEKGEIPYNRLLELMDDKDISEAARAKMYYYVSGHKLPMSTMIGSALAEDVDANGNIVGYIVEALGEGGKVIVSRRYKSQKEAVVARDRYERQVELNGLTMAEWVHDQVHEKMGDGVTAEKVRRRVNERYGVDIDKAIGKEPNRRSKEEQDAIDEYVQRLAGVYGKEVSLPPERQLQDGTQTSNIKDDSELGVRPNTAEKEHSEDRGTEPAAGTAERNGDGLPNETFEESSSRGSRGDSDSKEERLEPQRPFYTGGSQYATQLSYGSQVIERAKAEGLYIDPATLDSYGERHGKGTGESVVYIDKDRNRVVKVKDPFAKAPMKGNATSDALYEHLVHNTLFPEDEYRLLGVTEVNGEMRLVLEQDYVEKPEGGRKATKEEVERYLTEELGLQKEGNYWYGNEWVSITDVEADGDNVIVDGDGRLHFIDPIIKLKVPAREILGDSRNEESTAINVYDAAFERGHGADEQGRRDIAMELAMADEGNREERQAAWDGVRQRIEEEADEATTAEREAMMQQTHKDGTIRRVTLKEQDEDGKDKEAYVVDGNLVMTADGSMVDREASDKTVVIYDPATGERGMIDPTEVLTADEPVAMAAVEAEIASRRDARVRAGLDAASGKVSVEAGQSIQLPDGRGVVVMSEPDENGVFMVQTSDGAQMPVNMQDVQRAADEVAMADYMQRHAEGGQKSQSGRGEEIRESVEAVNARFNEELESMTEENAREVQLDCGRPSDVLLSCGVEDKPIRLYGAKLLSKAKKHGYQAKDIKGLPQALQYPIAVFKGSREGSFAILTELQIGKNNVLASLTVGKGGHDVDFNIISSVYGKADDSVVRWINSGKMLYVDKEKALGYISVSAPIAEAQSNQELNSAAKIVKEFENPQIKNHGDENRSGRQERTAGFVEGAPEEYEPGMEIVIRERGDDKRAIVTGSGRMWRGEGGRMSYEADGSGPVIEYMVEGEDEPRHDHRDKLTHFMVVGYMREADEGEISQPESRDAEQSGEGQENVVGRSLTEEEAAAVVNQMQQTADIAPEVELTPDNWTALFGEDGVVSTPLGEVKMGENQYFKLAQQGREGKLGMVKPTLEHPSIVIEDAREAKNGKSERGISYIFIKAFTKSDGSRYYFFTSVTVSKEGKEVVISNQERGVNRITTLLRNGKVAWLDKEFSLHPKPQIEESVPLNGSNSTTTTDNRAALLGINPSEQSEKGNTLQTAASKPHGGIALYRDILANVLYDGKGTEMSGTGKEKVASGLQTEQPTTDAMPMREDGEADFMATTPQRGHQFIYNEAGLSREEASQFVNANIEAAEKELKKLQGKAPKMGTSLVKYQQAKVKHEQQLAEAQRAVDYWQGVKAEQQKVVAAERQVEVEREAAEHEAAVAAEKQRQAEELAKQQEQAERGANAVHPAIREKWETAPKIEGVDNEITLPNGEKVKGHYVLTESGAATPSHNPNMEFVRNEGFPVDENGQTVNDRDYERDQEAQRVTRDMADRYDSRAIQSVPVVSQDGVVLSGNGRTMAGELAAQQNSDGEYIEHLKKYPQQFGFTAEQVEGMQHPRVLFVADEEMPYTTETFAKFNAQDMKSQSRTEQAVKLGKTVDDATFARVVSSINKFDTLGDFYNDPKAAPTAIGELHKAGAINRMQLAEMMDGEKVSGTGRQMLENMLIGKAFESNPDAIRQLSEYPAMRQNVVSALAELANNIKLGEEYSLAEELSQAIGLAYEARKAGSAAGDKVSWYARQQNLFPFEAGETVADYRNLSVMMLADLVNESRTNQLRNTLALYNDKAAMSAAGQMDIFSGGVRSKEDILKEVFGTIYYGTKKEQQAALAGARERRKAAAGVSEDGVAARSDAGGGTPIRGEGDLAEAKGIKYQLSDEVDENGRQFVLTNDGKLEFGVIGEETGLTSAPILLSEGMITNQSTKDGYGLVHIEARHGDEIRSAGYASVIDFIEEVAKHYEIIREGKNRDGIQTYMLQLTDKHNNTLMVELSGDGTYWNINTAGIFKTSYGAKRDVVYSRHTTANQSAETDVASLEGEQGGTTPMTSMNATAQQKDDGLLYKATALDAPANTSAEQPTVDGSLSSETVVKTEPQQPNDAVSSGSSLSASETSGISSAEPTGEPTVSEGEGTKKTETGKGKDVSDGNTEGAREQKAGGEVSAVSEREAELRDALVETMRMAGIEVSEDVEAGQAVLDWVNGRADAMSRGQKRTPEAVSVTQNEEHLQTVASGEDVAKIQKNLDTLAKKLENAQKSELKTILGEIAQALGARRYGSNSQYATFETKNGQIVTIRLSDHNAHTSGFDYSGRDNGISIVVSAKKSHDITNDGAAHVVEFYYDAIKLRRAEGKPLVEIVRGLEQALYSGEYVDRTGLAERQEVNGEDAVRFMKVYHGSGADFDAFDHSHMGEGEGAQAYGWGSYVTEVEGIGRMYAQEAASNATAFNTAEPFHSRYKGKRIPKGTEGRERFPRMVQSVASVVENGRASTFQEAIDELMKVQESAMQSLLDAGHEAAAEPYRQNMEALKALKEEDFQLERALRLLYTVEIPEDNGSNYLEWDKPVGKRLVSKVAKELDSRGLALAQKVPWAYENDNTVTKLTWILENESASGKALGSDVHEILADAFRANSGYTSLGDKEASELLHSLGYVGIKYPAEYRTGGREDGAKNYVIFDEKDLQITDKLKFFKTGDGQTYGYTYRGKIYIDPRIATAETPIHEYTHLWSEALRQANPEAWERLKSKLMGDKELMDMVRKRYPELEGDELMDEVFVHYSGRRGAERLRAEQEQMMKENKEGLLGVAKITALFNRLRTLLSEYWNKARQLFAGNNKHLDEMSAEDFADMALSDLLHGFNPTAEVKKQRADRHKAAQLREVVGKNPMEDSYHRGIRSIDDIKTIDEAVAEREREVAELGEGEPLSAYPDVSDEMLREAERSGRIRVYSSKPIENGAFVTPSRMQAEEYAGGGRVYSAEVDTRDVAWMDVDEGQMAKVDEVREEERDSRQVENEGQPMFHKVGEKDMAGRDVEAVNARFNEELERYEKGIISKNEHLTVGKPIGVLTDFMPQKDIILRQKVVTKAINKHHLTVSSIKNLPSALAEPIFVFRSKPSKISVLTELKATNGKNIFVAIELDVEKQMGHEFVEVNDILTIHDREYENIVKPIIENESLVWVDKSKGQHWLSSAKTNSQAITDEDLNSAAKIVKDFENPQTNLQGVDNRSGQDEESMERDAGYMAAVESGDMETAQWMVKEAAREAGYDTEAYHGTQNGSFTVFDNTKGVSHSGIPYEHLYVFSSSRNVADTYRMNPSSDKPKTGERYGATPQKPLHISRPDVSKVTKKDRRSLSPKQLGEKYGYIDEWGIVEPSGYWHYYATKEEAQAKLEEYASGEYSEGQVNMHVFLDLGNAYVFDAHGKNYRDAIAELEKENPKFAQTSRDYDGNWEGWLNEDLNGYDSLVIKNVYDNGSLYKAEISDVYYVKEPSQIKSADAVTYDGQGKVIPLSKRFDKRKEDIRYREVRESDAVGNGRDIALDDKAAQREYLLSDRYVAKLRGTEFEKSAEPLTERVAQYYKDKYDGKIEREGVGTILLDERSVKDSVSHGIGRNKVIAFAAVPDIIRDGAIIDRQENWKGRGYGSVTFAAPVEIGGEGYVGVVIAKELFDPKDGTHRFYLHEIALQKSLQSEEFKTGMVTGSKHGDVANVLRNIISAKNNSQGTDNRSGGADKTEAMRERVAAMSERLGTRMRVVDDVESITHENVKKQKRRRKSKGWYDPRTGEVVIVLPNNRSVEDVTATVAHEVIGHKGLRELIGKERFNAFLDEVYGHLKDKLKREIDRVAGRDFMDGLGSRSYEECRRKAVDEMLARLAEKPFEEMNEGERTLWQKIGDAVRKVLDEFLGTLKLPKWFKLGDNELRYILWRSMENLERGREDPIDRARDFAKRRELGLTEEAREGGREESRYRSERTAAEREVERLTDEENGVLYHKAMEMQADFLAKTGRMPLEMGVFTDKHFVIVNNVGDGNIKAVRAFNIEKQQHEVANAVKEVYRGYTAFGNTDSRRVLIEGYRRIYGDGAGDNLGRELEQDAGNSLRSVASRQQAERGGDNALAGGAHIDDNGVQFSEGRAGRRPAVQTKGTESIKNEVLGEFKSSSSGNAAGRRIPIGKLTAEGRRYLEAISGIGMKQDIDFVLNSSDLRHIYNEHYGNNEKDKGNNIPLTDDDIRSMVDVITQPDKIVYGESKKDGRKLFYFLKDSGDGAYNLAEVYTDKKGNLTAKTFYKTKKGSHQRAHELKNNPRLSTSETDGASLNSSAIIPKLFDIAEGDLQGADSEDVLFRDGETEDIWKDGSLGMAERIILAKVRLSAAHAEDAKLRDEARKAIVKNLMDLHRAMGAQREYDRSTTKRVADLARVLIRSGYMSEMSGGEVKRLLSAVKNATGAENIGEQVQKVMDIMVDHTLRMSERQLERMERVKGEKVDARGVQVQGTLDAAGQEMMKAFKEAKHLDDEKMSERIGDVKDRMGDADSRIAERAAEEYKGLMFARQYSEQVKEREEGIQQLRRDRDAEMQKIYDEDGRMKMRYRYPKTEEDKQTKKRVQESVAAIDEAIRQMKIEQVEAYGALIEGMRGAMQESMAGAKDFKAAEQKRVREIQHWANADMEGRELRGHRQDTRLQRIGDKVVSLVMQPLTTMDQMLRMFGRKNADGKGYLYHFVMNGWVDASDGEWTMKERYYQLLDEKAKEIFGKKVGFKRLYGYVDELPGLNVEYYDGVDMRPYTLTQSQLGYLYVVEKMPMGRATNRRMGFDDDTMGKIEQMLDPKLKAFLDWAQEELLPRLGVEANEVYRRMFGSNMDRIENYYPFKRDKDTLKREVENGERGNDGKHITTKTGAIMKRTANTVIWDMPNIDVLDVLAEHIDEMCHWVNFAELNRDISTLLSYKRFEQQVRGMHSVYGGGAALWDNFKNVAAILTDSYEPRKSKMDRMMVATAKGVTMGKINFRPFTAMKQILSQPAFWGEADPRYMLEDLASLGLIPWYKSSNGEGYENCVQWAWRNMPNYRKRVLSRTMGDYRLSSTDYDDDKIGRLMQKTSVGMLPNIGVDAWTIALGSHAVYRTMKEKYLRWGMSEEAAERQAIRDAEICFNKSQQSSEGAFMSTAQIDHTFATVSAMLFRNSSTAYTREWLTSGRNLKRMISGEVDVEFMTKQILRMREVETVSERFDRELEEQIAGRLQTGHVYQLGRPGALLQSAGVADLPIELSAERLLHKSEQENHPFELSEMRGLVKALNEPIAVFDSMTQAGSKVVLTELKHGGHHFVVIMQVRRRGGKHEVEINSIRSIYSKDSENGIVNWIKEGMMRYVDQEKLADFLAQSTNLAADEKASEETAKVINEFENADIPEQKMESEWSDSEWQEAEEQAKVEYRTAKARNTANHVIFGWVLPWLWRIGEIAPLLLLSGDDDKKKKKLEEATRLSMFGPMEGLYYGDVQSDFMNTVVNKTLGDGSMRWRDLGRNNPFISDVKNILLDSDGDIDGDMMKAANGVVNIIGGMVTGVNPQTLTDWVAAIIDVMGDDPALSNEAALFVARVLNCPQSQIKSVYYDEVGLTGTEASKYTPQQLAERYAAYQVKRGRMLTPWAWNDAEAMEKQTKKEQRTVKERTESRLENIANEKYMRYEERAKEIKDEIIEANKIEDLEERAERYGEISGYEDYEASRWFAPLDANLQEMAKQYLLSKSVEEARRNWETMTRYKEKMVRVLDERDAEKRSELIMELIVEYRDYMVYYKANPTMRRPKDMSREKEGKKAS